MTNWAGHIRLTDSARGQCGLYLLKGAEILWANAEGFLRDCGGICGLCRDLSWGGVRDERLNRARLSL